MASWIWIFRIIQFHSCPKTKEHEAEDDKDATLGENLNDWQLIMTRVKLILKTVEENGHHIKGEAIKNFLPL